MDFLVDGGRRRLQKENRYLYRGDILFFANKHL
jgi:hypothetical protein